MENISNYKSNVCDEAENNRILDELYKQKRHCKQTEGDNMSDYVNTGLNRTELSRNSLNNEVTDVHKQKKKNRHKLATEKVITENSEDQNISQLKRKNRKKRKHKLTNAENVSDCGIVERHMQEFEIETNMNFLDGMQKQKRKKDKHKLCDMKNMLIYQESVTDESEKNRILDVLHVHKGKDKHKQIEVDKISRTQTTDSHTIEISQNGLNSESLNGFPKKKKKKHKLLDEMENISDYNIQESAIDKSRINIALVVHKAMDKHEKTEADNISDYETAASNVIGINASDLNDENFGRFCKKKKKHKYKLFDEMENVSDCKTTDSNAIGISQNDLNTETLNRFHKKRKKKHKLLDEMENTADPSVEESTIVKSGTDTISDVYRRIDEHEQTKVDNIFHYETADSNVIGLNENDLNNEKFDRFHKKKKKKQKQKVLDEMVNTSVGNIQESAIDEVEKNRTFDTLDAPKRIDKCMQTDNCETIDSNSIEINQNNLSSGSFDGLDKPKRKKHRHNLPEVENIPKTIIESNNSSNNSMYYEHMKKAKEKNITENVVDNKPTGISRKSKKRFESEVNVILDNLPEKEKNVSCKGPKKEKNYQEGEHIYMSFDSCIHDMTDVPVSFPVPILHETETGASLTQERKAYLEENGVIIHNGKWTKTEDDILTRNFLQFGLKFGVNNPFQLLGINQNKKDNKLLKFLKAKHFWIHLGKDLNNRSLRSIYMRARKLLNPLKNKEKLSTEEASDLKYAHDLVGNKWTRISDMLSRSDNNCHTAYRWHKSDIKKGKWTPEEESNLIKAIKTVTGSEDISANNVKDISWKAVAKYVPTRNEFQCHKQWAEHLAWDSSVTEKKPWQKYHFGKLIYLIKDKYCFESESEIDFKELHKHFKHVTPSYIFLRKKWLYMKGRVPKELNLSYSKYLDVLMRMYEIQYKIFADEKL